MKALARMKVCDVKGFAVKVCDAVYHFHCVAFHFVAKPHLRFCDKFHTNEVSI